MIVVAAKKQLIYYWQVNPGWAWLLSCRNNAAETIGHLSLDTAVAMNTRR
jgi:hypothetical protein